MTIDELKTLLLEIDPALKKYHYMGSEKSYTVWEPHHQETLMSDNRAEIVTTKVTINRWTNNESDTIAQEIFDALEEANVPLDEMLTLYNPDAGQFRHIVECYVALEKEETQDE